MVEPADRPWKPIDCNSLSASAIDAVVQNTIPYVRVGGFLTDAWCDEIVRRFEAKVARRWGARLDLPHSTIETLVHTVELHGRSPDEYFQRVARDGPEIRSLFQGGEDPLETLRHAWTAAGWQHQQALEAGRPYSTDLVWSVVSGAAPPHVDDYPLNFECFVSRFKQRLSYNIYLQPSEGGEFVVYDRRREPGDSTDPLRSPSAAARIVAGSPAARYVPLRGDLILFDSYNYHEVTAVTGGLRRVVAHSTIGVDAEQRLITFYV